MSPTLQAPQAPEALRSQSTIPSGLPAASELADIAKTPRTWWLLATRAHQSPHDHTAAWEYPGIREQTPEAIDAFRAEILAAAEANAIFAPHRLTPTHWEWLAVSIPEDLRPARRERPRKGRNTGFAEKGDVS